MSTTATARQRTTVGVLVVVLVTVLWFQFLWRGQGEDAAGAVADGSAAGLVAEAADDAAATDGAAVTDDAAGVDDSPAAPATTVPAVPRDHVAELRIVHQAVTTAGVRLTGYLPVSDATAQIQLQASYEGLVTFLAELRTRAPGAVVAALAAAPGDGTLDVGATIEWRAS